MMGTADLHRQELKGCSHCRIDGAGDMDVDKRESQRRNKDGVRLNM